MKLKKLGAIALLMVVSLNMTGCTFIDSMAKTIESDTKGLHRRVEVIAMDGTVVKTYESKNMRVEDGNGGTVVLDFDGRRVTIVNADVIIEEIK